MMMSGNAFRLASTVLFLALLTFGSRTEAQTLTAAERTQAVGDEPKQELPLATDLSPAIRHQDVQKAIRKVADWQLDRARSVFSLDWTFAALDTGFMAASRSTGDPKYRQAMYEMGKSHDWQLGSRFDHADDQAVAQTYLELYLDHPEPAEIAVVKSRYDAILAEPRDDSKPPWWWCDALFMAPPTWTRLYKATGDIRYLDYMNHQWWVTSALLYDNSEHLYTRDATYLQKREANGKKIFWSRGNGWVMAGLVRVLEYMPADYPDRSRYVAQFKEMSASLAKVQGADGLWRPGLLDAGAYRLPEVSGSAFIAYAMAWGVNQGILDRKIYRPVVEHAWRGMIEHIYSDGRLGSMQPVGAAPGAFGPTASYVFGVGAFLLAGSEVDKMAGAATAALHSARADATSSVYQYSAMAGARRAYLWIPPRCGYVRGIIMAMSNLTERSWLEDPVIRQAAAEECLGIVWLGGGNGTPLNANLSEAGGEALDKLFEDLARESGYKELAIAPLIAMGHSANGQFSWNAANLHPERVIAAIPIKTVPLPASLGFAGVPLLYLVGETTEWPQFGGVSRPGDRDFFWPVVRDSAMALRSANQDNLIGVVTDPGGGHFDWSDHDARFVALYIHKACRYRLPKPAADGSRVKLNPISPRSGWLTDTGGMDPDRFPAATYEGFRGDPKKAYWFFDEETARAAVAFEGDRKRRAKQMLTFVEDGKPLAVATRGFAKLRFNPESDGITFKVRADFLFEFPPELVGAGTPLGHAPGPILFKRITGPAVQIAQDTFRVQFDRGTLDGITRPKEGTIWITEEHPGDTKYRHAVQPGQIVIPTRLNNGKSQQIDFPAIPNQKTGSGSVRLGATSTSHLPVAFYVVAGPAMVEGETLLFTDVPVKGESPIKVTVVAYQWGRMNEPAYQSAEPIEQTFLLER